MEADRKFTPRDSEMLKIFWAGYNSGTKVVTPNTSTDSETGKIEISDDVLLNSFFDIYFYTVPEIGSMKLLAQDFVLNFYNWQFTTAAQYKQRGQNEFSNVHNTVKGLSIKKAHLFARKKFINYTNKQLTLNPTHIDYGEARERSKRWDVYQRVAFWAVACEKTLIKDSLRV